jgi:hypothetical protein
MENIPKNSRVYSHQLRGGFKSGERSDLTQTLLFKSSELLSDDLEFTSQFYLSDQVSQFQISVNIISSKGTILHKNFYITSSKQVYT